MRKVLFIFVACAAFVSCKSGSGASFPGKSEVTTAQAAWCESLAKINGAVSEWEHMAPCKAHESTASANYLRRMTKCYGARVESYGEQAPDHSQMVAECNEEVVVAMGFDEAAGTGVIAARCDRMKKCEEVAESDCKTGVDKLENAQKVMMTNTFNPAALADIADCLRSRSCTDNEEAARDACYAEPQQKLLWFP